MPWRGVTGWSAGAASKERSFFAAATTEAEGSVDATGDHPEAVGTVLIPEEIVTLSVVKMVLVAVDVEAVMTFVCVTTEVT